MAVEPCRCQNSMSKARLLSLTLPIRSMTIRSSITAIMAHDAARCDILAGVMNRRQFFSAGAAGLGLAALDFAQSKPLRVGLIGCGWYGKTDLLRMIQVAPVEVVSLCDVDSTMLS